jgi:hypothetical protein
VSVSDSLSTQLLHADIEIPCPSCEYPVWVRLAEVTAQCFVRCPCCHVLIRLQDDTGTVHTAGALIEQQLRRALKGLS